MHLRRLIPLVLMFCWFGANAAAPGPTYPGGPVTIVVPFAPGGGTDLVGRVFAKALSKQLHASVIVKNHAGAGTTIGTAFVAHSTPDGLTLLLNGSTLTYQPAMYRRLPYDVKKDLIPVTFVSDQPYALIVNKDFPAQNLQQLVAMAKQSPGTIAYGSAGIGSAMHLSAALLWDKLDIEMLHVPYPGTSQAMTDLIGGRVKVVYTTAAGASEMVRAGTVRALGVSSEQRLSTMPNIPTIAQAGLPGYTQGSWLAIFAPAGTPASITQRIVQASAEAIKDPELIHQFAAEGLEPKTTDPSTIKPFFDSEIDRWGGVIKAAGIQPQ